VGRICERSSIRIDATGRSDVADKFRYKAVPHTTLRSIAWNANLGPIFAQREPILGVKVEACGAAWPYFRRRCDAGWV
jgi:hypothetical protein